MVCFSKLTPSLQQQASSTRPASMDASTTQNATSSEVPVRVAEGPKLPDGVQLGEEEVTTACGSGRGGCRPFSRDIVVQLKEMWTAGMVGGGESYEEMIQLACVRTGLSSSQVKVS